MSLGLRFLSAVAGDTPKEWFRYGGRLPPLFEDDPQAEAAFKFVDEFARKHGKIPGAQTIKEATGLVLPVKDTEAEWLFTQLCDRRIKRKLALAGADVQKVLATDPKQALSIMHSASVALMSEVTTPEVYDFKQAIHTLWPWLMSRWKGEFKTVPLPWPHLSADGGVEGGEVFSIVGRTGLGKTWLMLAVALYVWQVLKQPVVFVSLEIMARKIMERLAAMYTPASMDFFKQGYNSTVFGALDFKPKVYDALVALEVSDMPPFIVVDGNMAAGVIDVLSVCHRYQPVACFVDGAYMLRHPNPRIAVHEKIKENIEAMKRDIATAMDMAMFCSWQFNRDATRVKAGTTPGTEHIGGGDGIGNTSSVVVGLFEGDTTSNAESLKKRKVNILKGRNGERGEFDIHWDFNTMDFGEVDKTVKPVPHGGDLADEQIEMPV